MPQPAVGDGPWGEAIRYWLNQRNWRQADLARESRLPQNTISNAARGFPTTTRVLVKIARAFQITVAEVLVSPERRLANEERIRIAKQITEDVLRTMDARGLGPSHPATERAMLHMDHELERREMEHGHPPQAEPFAAKSKKSAVVKRRAK